MSSAQLPFAKELKGPNRMGESSSMASTSLHQSFTWGSAGTKQTL